MQEELPKKSWCRYGEGEHIRILFEYLEACKKRIIVIERKNMITSTRY